MMRSMQIVYVYDKIYDDETQVFVLMNDQVCIKVIEIYIMRFLVAEDCEMILEMGPIIL